jgi:hypothetical protein
MRARVCACIGFVLWGAPETIAAVKSERDRLMVKSESTLHGSSSARSFAASTGSRTGGGTQSPTGKSGSTMVEMVSMASCTCGDVVLVHS